MNNAEAAQNLLVNQILLFLQKFLFQPTNIFSVVSLIFLSLHWLFGHWFARRCFYRCRCCCWCWCGPARVFLLVHRVRYATHVSRIHVQFRVINWKTQKKNVTLTNKHVLQWAFANYLYVLHHSDTNISFPFEMQETKIWSYFTSRLRRSRRFAGTAGKHGLCESSIWLCT